MRYLSVCSGIEAATVAWHPLGWTPAAFAEIASFPSAVLAHHYPPAVPNVGDFTTITAERLRDIGPVQLLVGGSGDHARLGRGVPLRMMRVLSLGAGVQSSTLLLMAAAGVIEAPDTAIFADTQWEPRRTYEWLRDLAGVEFEPWWDADDRKHWRAIPGLYSGGLAGLPVHVVTAGSIREAVYEAKSSGARYATLPLYTLDRRGDLGRQRRQCTREFKIEPQVRMIRELLADRFALLSRPGFLVRGWRVPAGVHVEQWFGITTDEITRVKDSRYAYIRHRYPLIELGMTRDDCVAWCAERGFHPPKSACVGCGYRRDPEWRRMKEENPEEFADAVAFDHLVREGQPGLRAQAFVHDSRIPLDQVDFSTAEELGQGVLFDGWADECEGMCGV
jgi:hypothetical protein